MDTDCEVTRDLDDHITTTSTHLSEFNGVEHDPQILLEHVF